MNQDPKEVAARAKLSFSAVPPLALRRIAEALNTGAAKYGRFNWRPGRVHFSTYFDATLRHLLAYSDGERCDPESGLSHLAHAAASLCVLLDAVENAAEYVHDGSRPFFESRDPRPEASRDRIARQARAVYGGPARGAQVDPLPALDRARLLAQTPGPDDGRPRPACLFHPSDDDEGTGSGLDLLQTLPREQPRVRHRPAPRPEPAPAPDQRPIPDDDGC